MKRTVHTPTSLLTCLLLAVLAPGPVCSCSFVGKAPAPVPLADVCSAILSTRAGAFPLPSEADVFVYDAKTGLLDAWQKVAPGGGRAQIRSTSGMRHAVVLSGFDTNTLTYDDILSYKSLINVVQDIAHEDPAHPVMSGECTFNAGKGSVFGVELTPLLCRVRLDKLEVDFTGRPYAREELTDIKVYLINVSGRCGILDKEASPPTEIVNCGRYDPALTSLMAHPELLGGTFGTQGSTMYCYPCRGEEGVAGRPVTRLVVEGKIRGNTYYYPIDIAGGTVERGISYNYSLRITRTGGTDPDSPLKSGTVDIHLETDDWNENEDQLEEY